MATMSYDDVEDEIPPNSKKEMIFSRRFILNLLTEFNPLKEKVNNTNDDNEVINSKKKPKKKKKKNKPQNMTLDPAKSLGTCHICKETESILDDEDYCLVACEKDHRTLCHMDCWRGEHDLQDCPTCSKRLIKVHFFKEKAESSVENIEVQKSVKVASSSSSEEEEEKLQQHHPNGSNSNHTGKPAKDNKHHQPSRSAGDHPTEQSKLSQQQQQPLQDESQEAQGTEEAEQDKHEFGIILVAKDTYGFIMTITREENVFYHNGELIDKQPIKVGDIVQFIVGLSEKRPGEQYATQVEILQKDNLQQNVSPHDLSSHLREILRKWLNDNKDKITRHCAAHIGSIIYTRENYGFLRCDGTDYFYHASETPTNLQVGDQVEFFVSMNKTNQDKPCAVKLKFMCRQREKQRGKIVTSKEKYGFIYNEKTNSNLFYHISEVQPITATTTSPTGNGIVGAATGGVQQVNNKQQLKVGDIVEFATIHNARTGKENAISIELITEERLLEEKRQREKEAKEKTEKEAKEKADKEAKLKSKKDAKKEKQASTKQQQKQQMATAKSTKLSNSNSGGSSSSNNNNNSSSTLEKSPRQTPKLIQVPSNDSNARGTTTNNNGTNSPGVISPKYNNSILQNSLLVGSNNNSQSTSYSTTTTTTTTTVGEFKDEDFGSIFQFEGFEFQSSELPQHQTDNVHIDGVSDGGGVVGGGGFFANNRKRHQQQDLLNGNAVGASSTRFIHRDGIILDYDDGDDDDDDDTSFDKIFAKTLNDIPRIPNEEDLISDGLNSTITPNSSNKPTKSPFHSMHHHNGGGGRIINNKQQGVGVGSSSAAGADAGFSNFSFFGFDVWDDNKTSPSTATNDSNNKSNNSNNSNNSNSNISSTVKASNKQQQNLTTAVPHDFEVLQLFDMLREQQFGNNGKKLKNPFSNVMTLDDLKKLEHIHQYLEAFNAWFPVGSLQQEKLRKIKQVQQFN